MSKIANKTILIVDDEALIRELFALELENFDAKIIEASNGRDAFEILTKEKIDFVVSDVVMANGSGIELLEKYAELPQPKPPIIMVSGYSDLSPEKAKKLGAHRLFAKPFEINEILDFIEENI